MVAEVIRLRRVVTSNWLAVSETELEDYFIEDLIKYCSVQQCHGELNIICVVNTVTFSLGL